MLVVDDVLGMQVRFKAEGLVVIHAELGQMLLLHAAGGQDLLHILLGDHQRLRHLGFLVHLDPLTDLIMDGLNHIHAALLPQGIAQQRFKGLLLLCGRLGNRGIEQGFDQGILIFLDILGIVKGVIDVG